MRLLDPTLKHKDKFRLQSDSLSPSKKNCDIFFNESPLKMITNAFYFIFISFSGYLIFFLTFWPSRKNGLIRNIKLISKFMISQPGWQTITIHTLANILWMKGNQTMKFDQLKEYHKRNIFLQNSCRKWSRETSSRPLCFLKKLYIR